MGGWGGVDVNMGGWGGVDVNMGGWAGGVSEDGVRIGGRVGAGCLWFVD